MTLSDMQALTAALAGGDDAIAEPARDQALTLAAARYALDRPQRVIGTAADVPLADREAVCGWAAALLLEQRASAHAGDREPGLTGGGGHIDFQGQAGRLAARAKRLRRMYFDHMGLNARRAVPAMAAADFDRGDGRGRDRLFHPQGRR